MTAIIFEDEGWTNFSPLTQLRHVSELLWGTRSIGESLRDAIPEEDLGLWGREELGRVVRERNGLDYNTSASGEVLLVNARAKPVKSLASLFTKKGKFAAFAGGVLVATKTTSLHSNPGILTLRMQRATTRGLNRLELGEDPLFKGTWDLVESNGLAIAEQSVGFGTGSLLPKKAVVKGPGPNLKIHESAEVEEMVMLDTRLGPVLVDEDVVIESFSRLSGPCYVGPRTKVRSGLIRSGTSIFENCRVGGEIENSIIMPFTNKAHHGYVGETIVGEWVNLGAGSTFSNLKNTYGNVRVEVEGKQVGTTMTKLGPVVGDMAKVSIGSLIFAGKTVGTGSHVTDLVAENVPAFTYYDGASGRKVELRLDSVLETQRRMMERRGKTLSKPMESLLKLVYEETASDRKRSGVRKGDIG